jgi:hypothetical protein
MKRNSLDMKISWIMKIPLIKLEGITTLTLAMFMAYNACQHSVRYKERL